jgi:hypothetical protein
LNDKGDVLTVSTLDGANINVENGIVEMTIGFDTAVYLSLLGGNQEDDGTEATKNKEWWGNKLEDNNPDRKLTSRFQNIIYGLPATPGNLRKLDDAGKQDLQWFIILNIADEIDFDLRLLEKNRLNISVILWKDKNKLSETKYSLNWGVVNGT